MIINSRKDRDYVQTKYALEYIRDMLNDSKIKLSNINDGKFHHNATYDAAPLIVQYGVLSMRGLRDNKIYDFVTDEYLDAMDSPSHVNGINRVSLSTDCSNDEFRGESFYYPKWDYTVSYDVDIVISNLIEPYAYKNTTYYANEYTATDIKPEFIRSVDIRLLQGMDSCDDKNNINFLTCNYNYLQSIARSIMIYNPNIFLREMSLNHDNFALDIEKVEKNKMLILV